MIKIRIKNYDNEIDIRFPVSENELYAKLAQIHAIGDRPAAKSAYVTEVYWPEELSVLPSFKLHKNKCSAFMGESPAFIVNCPLVCSICG